MESEKRIVCKGSELKRDCFDMAAQEPGKMTDVMELQGQTVMSSESNVNGTSPKQSQDKYYATGWRLQTSLFWYCLSSLSLLSSWFSWVLEGWLANRLCGVK